MAYDFSGSNTDYVEVQWADLPSTDLITVSSWVYLTTGNDRCYWCTQEGVSISGGLYFAAAINASNHWRFEIRFAGGLASYVYPAISLNTVTHVAVTWDLGSGANAPSVYYNGVLQTAVSSSASSGAVAPGDANWSIGSVVVPGGRAFNGELWDFSVRGRILSEREISGEASGWSALTNPRGMESGFYCPLNDTIDEIANDYTTAVSGASVVRTRRPLIQPVSVQDMTIPVAANSIVPIVQQQFRRRRA